MDDWNKSIQFQEQAREASVNKHLLYAGAGVAAILLTAPAGAQSGNPIDYCRQNSDGKSERIACLEAAITALMSQTTAAVATPSSSDTASVPPAPAQLADIGAGPEKDGMADVAQDLPTGLGAEQVAAKRERESKKAREEKKEKEKAEAVTARIIDFARSASGRLIMVLDNGQVWAQRTSDNANVRLREGDTPTVRIKRGAISGYRMEISDPNLTVVVERLQ